MEDNDKIYEFELTTRLCTHKSTIVLHSQDKTTLSSSSCGTDIPLWRIVKKISWSLPWIPEHGFLKNYRTTSSALTWGWAEVLPAALIKPILNRWVCLYCTCSDGQEWEEAVFWPIAFCRLCCDIQTSMRQYKEGDHRSGSGQRAQIVYITQNDLKETTSDNSFCTVQRTTNLVANHLHVPHSHDSPSCPLLYNTWDYYLQNYRRSCSLQETIPCRICVIPVSVSCLSETYDSYL
jgi:hypothetical protein